MGIVRKTIGARLGLAVALAAGLLLSTPLARATPTFYDIGFTNTLGSTTPTGSFFYDPTTQTFSDFFVQFDGFLFNFTALANSPGSAQCGGNPVGAFAIMSGTTSCVSNQVWVVDSTAGLIDINSLFASNTPLAADPRTMDVEGLTIHIVNPSVNIADGGTFTIVPTTPPAPITYNIDFTNTLGSMTPTGSFTFDPATQTFSNFVVQFNGAPIDFTAVANNPNHPTCDGLPLDTFAIMNGTTTCLSNQVWVMDSTAGLIEIDSLFASNDPLAADPRTMDVEGATVHIVNPPVSFADGGTFTIAPTVSAVPEPASLAIFAAGLVGVGWLRRRRSIAEI